MSACNNENTIEFKKSEKAVSYEEALSFMEARVADIKQGAEPECVWALEHPSIYTAGTSANSDDLIEAKFPVYKTGRGGQYTYHGPGQRVYYIMLNLKNRQETPDIKQFVFNLEETIIQTLACFDIKGERREGRVGIWVQSGATENKIAAIGVRVRHWITFHGVSINLNPNLSHFGGIVPCGIAEHGVTSLHKEGVKITPDQLDDAFFKCFEKIFNPRQV